MTASPPPPDGLPPPADLSGPSGPSAPVPRGTLWLRAAATLALALAAALLCVALNTPIPWMLGPLLAVSAASVLGAPVQSATPLRNAGQWAIGTALGLYFTPAVGALILSLWWAILLSIGWALLLGVSFAWVLHRLHAGRLDGLDRSTAYFSGSIGAASEMAILAEREGARAELVAAAHSTRLLIVTIVLPFAMQWAKGYWGLQAVDVAPVLREVRPPGLAALAAATGAGIWLMHRLDRANPFFMGALVVSMALTLGGAAWSAVPQALSNAAQLVIGVSLGVRFTPRWLGTVALGTLVMMLLSLGFGLALAWATGLHAATLILGTAPGGIAEMAITAKVLQLGVPVVTAFQVCRLVAVLVLAEPVYHLLARRGGWREEAA